MNNTTQIAAFLRVRLWRRLEWETELGAKKPLFLRRSEQPIAPGCTLLIRARGSLRVCPEPLPVSPAFPAPIYPEAWAQKRPCSQVRAVVPLPRHSRERKTP